MKDIVFATNNEHKLSELRQIMVGKYNVLSLADIGCHDDIPETASTIEGNAMIKAQWVKEHYGYDCFSDDTGLEIDELGGEPGVHSARYGGVAHDSERNIDKVLTAIVLIMNGQVHTFEGKVEGHILTSRHGTGGFGYDPIFKPDEAECAFGEMSAEQKNSISHRGRAVAKLTDFLNQK